ncbi:hypothetical protein J6590_015816 [Homalodisca vitripennis]|nr:hypothetical protein J6590_015816 [Homalodisca vitripennis]
MLFVIDPGNYQTDPGHKIGGFTFVHWISQWHVLYVKEYLKTKRIARELLLRGRRRYLADIFNINIIACGSILSSAVIVVTSQCMSAQYDEVKEKEVVFLTHSHADKFRELLYHTRSYGCLQNLRYYT